MALIFEKRNKTAYLTINRPEAMNAMDPETYSELSQAWIEIRDDPNIWCAIITGAGDKAFSAGADLKKLSQEIRKNGNYGKLRTSKYLTEVWKYGSLS